MRLSKILFSLAALLNLTSPSPAAEPLQQEKCFEREITVKARLRYLLFLPDGYGQDEKRWPLLLFLHGAGESGDDLSRVKLHGPPKLIENKTRDFPCIVVSPQSARRGWNPDELAALLDDLAKDYRVDPDRVYVTGLSMGGFGTWALAAAHPDRFAAIVPICGGGNPADAAKLKHLAIWVFHGAKDPVVPLRASETMVEALKKAGADVKFTVYPEAGHDSWTATYEDPELYHWLFAQKRSQVTATGRVTFDGQPLRHGKIVFHPDRGEPRTVQVKDGIYATQLPPGQMRVTIEASTAPDAGLDPAKSGLIVELAPGVNEFNFDLQR